METRANHIWVGGITLALMALAAGFALWLVHVSQNQRNLYDIYFRQSVDGLATGTQVSYAGVPAGQITQIELSHDDPGMVRVRIAIDQRIPLLVGTTATIQSSFTGVSNVLLAGGGRGSPAIVAPGPDGVPVIPTKRSGIGELLTNAPLLMERLAGLTERLTNMLSDKNQKSIEGILANTNRMTATLADASPQVKVVLADLDQTLQQATQTLTDFQKVAGTVNATLDADGPSLAGQLRDTLKSAQAAADALKATMAEASPAARRLNDTTLPQAEATIREVRATSRALRDLTEKIDNQGAAAAVGAPKLPEYRP